MQPELDDPSERFPYRLMQFAVALVIGCVSIYCGVENGMLIAARCFMGAYGATLGVNRLFGLLLFRRLRQARNGAALARNQSSDPGGRLLGSDTSRNVRRIHSP